MDSPWLYSIMPNWYDLFYGQVNIQETNPSLEFIQWFMTYINLEVKNSNHKILDMGAGTGRLLVPLTQLGYCIEGMEPYEGMIKVAQTKAKSAGVEISLRKGSFQSLSEKSKYRLIFGINGTMAYLYSSEEYIQAFKNIFRALVPGGFFLVDLTDFYGLIKRYKTPEPQKIEIDGKDALFVFSHKIDLNRTIWIHHSRILVPNQGEDDFTDHHVLHEDIHELSMISLRELRYYAKLAGLEFVENYQSYEDRPDNRKEGTRLIGIFQKPEE